MGPLMTLVCGQIACHIARLCSRKAQLPPWKSFNVALFHPRKCQRRWKFSLKNSRHVNTMHFSAFINFFPNIFVSLPQNCRRQRKLLFNSFAPSWTFFFEISREALSKHQKREFWKEISSISRRLQPNSLQSGREMSRVKLIYGSGS